MTEPEEFDGPPLVDERALRAEVQRLRTQVEHANSQAKAAEARAQRAEATLEGLRSSRTLRLAGLRHKLRERENLLKVLREAWQIVRRSEPADHHPAASSSDQTRSPANLLASLRAALRARDNDAATRLLAMAEGMVTHQPEFLRLKRDVLIRRGELSFALDVTRELAAVTSSPEFRADERFAVGRLLETDPKWKPRIPGSAGPVAPRADNIVLHLLKESLPYHNNGFCMRSHYSLLAMKAAGVDPVVVTSPGFPYRDGVSDFPLEESIDGIPHHRIDLGYPSPAKVPYDDYLRDYLWTAARLARRIRPAIIHAGSGYRGYESALVGRGLRESLGLPFVYEVRSFFETTWTPDLDVAERGEHFERRYSTENRCMQAADVVITIAEAMRDEIVERGVDASRVFVIPNGVDAQVFAPRTRNAELVRRYGLDRIPTFGYVSNLDHIRENQELLIDAVAVLKARGRRAKCLIVGDGSRRQMLENRARDRGVASDVVFTGKVRHDQIQDYYALLDVFVVPRAPERAARLVTPLKPYEAMAMGVPCIVSALPALLEITGDGTRGLSFPAEDTERLADALEYMFDHPGAREELGKQARTWVASERSWSANGERYVEAYDHARAAYGSGAT
jgi:glycosyltransferase involved in cell wall biosynthesis